MLLQMPFLGKILPSFLSSSSLMYLNNFGLKSSQQHVMITYLEVVLENQTERKRMGFLLLVSVLLLTGEWWGKSYVVWKQGSKKVCLIAYGLVLNYLFYTHLWIYDSVILVISSRSNIHVLHYHLYSNFKVFFCPPLISLFLELPPLPRTPPLLPSTTTPLFFSFPLVTVSF